MENKNDRAIKAIDIVKEYIPLFYNSENYKWNVLSVIDENSEWTNDLIDFVEKHKDNRKLIVQTIMHDIGGLMREDEHFVPRI
tara:strand:+ start:455 stop:703 length:249 start_codon:yes stop_codon:yes gene_type:complete